MATEITKYLDSAGKEWSSAVEADASDAKIANQAAVEAFVKENYSKATANGRKSPAARAAANAIYRWIGSNSNPVELTA